MVLVLLWAFVNAQTTQAQDDAFWEAPVLAQPFDTEPFRPVRIPSWVQETVGCGYTLSAMDREARERARSHGVTISELGFVDPFYAYYDSKLIERRSPHVPMGKLEQDIAEYERLGIRILGVYPPTLQGEVYEKHPEWRRIATNTTEIPQVDLQQHPYGGMLCLLGPYGDFLIEVLAEILTFYPQVDAFSFDGLHYGGVCYCQSCRAAYRETTGEEIPDVNLEDPGFRRYQHWADRRLEDLVRRMQQRLKSIKPDVALVTWTTNAGRFGHLLTIPRNMPARMNLLFDAPDQEFWMDETNRGATIIPAFSNAYAWAVTNHRVAFSEPYLMSHGNPYGKDSFPPQEIFLRMMLAATYGAAPSLAVAQPGHLQQEVYRYLDELERRKPWLTHKTPEPWAAMVMSDNTRTFYGRASGFVEERYLASVLGTFRAAVEEHLPITIINDWNLDPDYLRRFPVLLLPNTACLDDRQVAAIDEYVRNGGGLVASLDVSLFDEYGNPRTDFALAETLGVRYRGLPDSEELPNEQLDVNFAVALGPDYWDKRKNVFDFRQDTSSFLNQGRMQTYVADQAVTFKGPAIRVAIADEQAQTIGTLRARSENAEEMPAIVARQHGRGRVVYFAAGLDSAYYLYAYPYQRLALREAMLWAASAAPPVRVQAPMCVHSTVMRQTKDAQRLVVHLFNDLNTTAHHAFPNDDVPLREEVVPIHQIEITFAPTYRLRRVHLQPEGVELEVTHGADGARVTVPKLEVHSMVVAELEQD